MPGIYDLTPGGAPPLGQTRYNPCRSLHGDQIAQSQKRVQAEKARKPTPPIDALPLDSSSDEELDGQQAAKDEPSDDSEFGENKKTKKASGNPISSASSNLSSVKGDDGEKKSLSVEPSNIRPGSFTSGTGPRSRNSSQGSQKRKDAILDDDDDPFFHSQKKRNRQSYGHGSANIHRGSISKPDNSTKKSPKAGPSFKQPGSDAIIARVDGLRAKAKESKKPEWRQASSMQISQRDQRASQRSVKSTQDSSQSSPKSFKQPLRPSPKKVTKSRATPIKPEELDPTRSTRSSASAKQSPVLTENNALISSNFQNALNTATDKLGLSNMHINVPPSTVRDSTAPPTSLDAPTTVSSPLSSLDDSVLDFSQEVVPIKSEDIIITTKASRPDLCPICKQPVEKMYLEEHTKVGTRMSLRQQAQFCKAHKERSAKSEWAERGYPDIDWPQLDNRLLGYHVYIDDILSRRQFSFYRNVFEDSLKSGKNKTLQESLMGDEIEGTSPGYYGGRGAKVMADNIMLRFAGKIRRLAASDKLISSGGVSRYVQAVLVPELAVLLIKDDIKVDEEKAREVLRDSVDIGNLLNEEEDEMITDPAPTEAETVNVT